MNDHNLAIELGTGDDLRWAQEKVTQHHYLRQPVDPRARPMVYVLRDVSRPAPAAPQGLPVGLVMLGIPHATKCAGWWGYPGLPTQWQVVDLCRIWVNPYYQRGELGIYAKPGEVPGYLDRKGVFRPTVASWAIHEVLRRVQADRVRLWPPVYPAQPYHIELAISYHDPKFHRGTIYRESHAVPMYTDSQRQPIPGPSGKFGWCWWLGQPEWGWQNLTGIKPRTMRLF